MRLFWVQEELHAVNIDKREQALNKIKNEKSGIWQKHHDGYDSDYENITTRMNIWEKNNDKCGSLRDMSNEKNNCKQFYNDKETGCGEEIAAMMNTAFIIVRRWRMRPTKHLQQWQTRLLMRKMARMETACFLCQAAMTETTALPKYQWRKLARLSMAQTETAVWQGIGQRDSGRTSVKEKDT